MKRFAVITLEIAAWRINVFSSVITVSSTKVFCGPWDEEVSPLLYLSGKAGVNGVGSDGLMSKVTRSIRVRSGISSPKEDKCCEAKALSSETWQNQEGESLAPKTRPIGIIRNSEKTNAWADEISGWYRTLLKAVTRSSLYLMMSHSGFEILLL